LALFRFVVVVSSDIYDLCKIIFSLKISFEPKSAFK